MQDTGKTRDRLLRHLNDRSFVTGTVLGRDLGISRAAVHKHIDALKAAGLPVEGISGRGYRLARGVIPLDRQSIEKHLDSCYRRQIRRIMVEHCVDSTSAVLARLAGTESVHGVVCMAEAQPAGRGRRGKSWIASPYRNLLMSLGWVYDSWPRDLTGLSVATGIVLVDAITAFGVNDLGVKWPNDIVFDGKKLGGILIDIAGEYTGRCTIVVGIGINVQIDDDGDMFIDQPWTDLTRILGHTVDRNQLASSCLYGLCRMLSGFPDTGFDPYRIRWADVDVLTGKEIGITCHAEESTVTGVVLGLDAAGALSVAVEGRGTKSFYSGEVSVRQK